MQLREIDGEKGTRLKHFPESQAKSSMGILSNLSLTSLNLRLIH